MTMQTLEGNTQKLETQRREISILAGLQKVSEIFKLPSYDRRPPSIDNYDGRKEGKYN